MILYRISYDAIDDDGDLCTFYQWGGSVVPLKKAARALIPTAVGTITVDKFDVPGRDAVCAVLNEEAKPDEEVITYEGEGKENHGTDCDCGQHEGDQEDDDDMEDLLS